ncbi:hypothetical protein QBC39DRAFT_433042 [Podospora conica]|nr:hypothetical protein QBC39DRAFT_433042 [Schizothecium conicum]
MRFVPAARCLALAQHLRPSHPFAHSPLRASFSTSLPAMAANGSVSPDEGTTLEALPKSWTFTSSLPADPLFPTPADSHKTPRNEIGPRQVRNAIFTWVRPERQQDPELLAVSPRAMRDLGLAQSEADTEDFKQTAAGNKIHGFDESTLSGPGYPWAQCYGGYQFGDWAGQLGDGRAISLFEATNPRTHTRYEVQLKGAGLTPYSRFADGKAVLRSSIREFIVSESLNALGIPSTRALALTLLPHSRVRRETMEPGAIVVRFAQSWLRFGTFDLLRARADRNLTRQLATYVAEDVYGGWDKLPSRLADPSDPDASPPPARGVPADEVQGPEGAEENRFARLFREIVRRNAETVAHWQAYGFMNGVLNTDNTSILGLSIDFGPFAFMDTFDPAYTPNHDDFLLRYAYRNQPTIIWWNLVRLAESLGELLGAGPLISSPTFLASGVPTQAAAEPLIARAEKLIDQASLEYKSVFLTTYKSLMARRLGLRTVAPTDFADLLSPLLDTLEALALDFPLFFRRLSNLRVADLATDGAREDAAGVFFSPDPETPPAEDARKRVGDWLALWRARVVEDWGEADADAERMQAMRKVNPAFVPRGWVLDEVIRRVEKEGERDVLRRVMHMATNPFEEGGWSGRTKTEDGRVYEGDAEEERRWTGDVPRLKRALQCSCSS